jgi:hypothetical protein
MQIYSYHFDVLLKQQLCIPALTTLVPAMMTSVRMYLTKSPSVMCECAYMYPVRMSFLPSATYVCIKMTPCHKQREVSAQKYYQDSIHRVFGSPNTRVWIQRIRLATGRIRPYGSCVAVTRTTPGERESEMMRHMMDDGHATICTHIQTSMCVQMCMST